MTLHKEVNAKQFSNFTVVRHKYVYVIFRKKKNKKRRQHSYHVNITKVPSTAQIESAIVELSNVIASDFVVKSCRVENLTCSSDIGFAVPLLDAFDQLKEKSFVRKLRFNPERFPGMFVTLESNTVLLFSSGKIVIIGANNQDSVKLSIGLIKSVLDCFKPTTQTGTSSVSGNTDTSFFKEKEKTPL